MCIHLISVDFVLHVMLELHITPTNRLMTLTNYNWRTPLDSLQLTHDSQELTDDSPITNVSRNPLHDSHELHVTPSRTTIWISQTTPRLSRTTTDSHHTTPAKLCAFIYFQSIRSTYDIGTTYNYHEPPHNSHELLLTRLSPKYAHSFDVSICSHARSRGRHWKSNKRGE